MRKVYLSEYVRRAKYQLSFVQLEFLSMLIARKYIIYEFSFVYKFTKHTGSIKRYMQDTPQNFVSNIIDEIFNQIETKTGDKNEQNTQTSNHR